MGTGPYSPGVDISAAILCDAATVREGLLHVLGGGVTRVWRTELPAPFAVDLAMILTTAPAADVQVADVHATLFGPDAERLFQIGGEVRYEGGMRLEPGELQAIPIVFPFRDAASLQYGRHDIDLTIDGESVRRLAVWVLHPEEQALPPLD